MVAVAAANSEAEDGCVPRGTIVGGEVGSNGVRRHHNISLVWRLGGDASIYFCMPSQTKGTAYYVVGGGVLCWWRNTILVAETEAKREVGANLEEV